MGKIRFETKELIISICSLALYVGLEMLQRGLINAGILPSVCYDWVKARVLVVGVLSGICGPLVGGICGVGGSLLVNLMFYGYVSWMEIVVYGIFACMLGKYWIRFGVYEGDFRGIKFVDFVCIETMANIFCSLMFTPLTLFMTENMNLARAIVIGIRSAFGNSVLVGTVGLLIMVIVNARCSGRQNL